MVVVVVMARGDGEAGMEVAMVVVVIERARTVVAVVKMVMVRIMGEYALLSSFPLHSSLNTAMIGEYKCYVIIHVIQTHLEAMI